MLSYHSCRILQLLSTVAKSAAAVGWADDGGHYLDQGDRDKDGVGSDSTVLFHNREWQESVWSDNDGDVGVISGGGGVGGRGYSPYGWLRTRVQKIKRRKGSRAFSLYGVGDVFLKKGVFSFSIAL